MLPEPQSLVGTWRRFGTVGPVYEIIGLGKELSDHDRMMRVRVVESGEKWITASPTFWTIATIRPWHTLTGLSAG
jgi:hypothetical protein